MPDFKSLRLFPPLRMSTWKNVYRKYTALKAELLQVHHITVLFAGVFLCTFQLGKCTFWGSSGVKHHLKEVQGRRCHVLTSYNILCARTPVSVCCGDSSLRLSTWRVLSLGEVGWRAGSHRKTLCTWTASGNWSAWTTVGGQIERGFTLMLVHVWMLHGWIIITHTCTYTHTRTPPPHTHTHIHTHTRPRANARTHARTHARARAHARTHTHTHTRTHTDRTEAHSVNKMFKYGQ